MNAPLPPAWLQPACASGPSGAPAAARDEEDAPPPPAWRMQPRLRLALGDERGADAAAGGCTAETGQDAVAEELPVALVLNGLSQAVMLASPADLADFALGFCLSEGLLQAPHELRGLSVHRHAEGLELRLDISPRRFADLKQRRRSLAGRTGCGLCGVESLEALRRDLTPLPPADPATAVAPDAIARALAALPAAQTLFARTGAVHAAAWADAEGRLQAVREDVGRHNALDKLIGARAAAGADFASGFALVTSRASLEMVQKLASVGGGLLVAVSAPTAHAVRSAEALGLGLVGFARDRRLSVYTHPGRLGLRA